MPTQFDPRRIDGGRGRDLSRLGPPLAARDARPRRSPYYVHDALLPGPVVGIAAAHYQRASKRRSPASPVTPRRRLMRETAILLAEATPQRGPVRICTFGGGTPMILAPEDFAAVIDRIPSERLPLRASMPRIAPVESNPRTLEPEMSGRRWLEAA